MASLPSAARTPALATVVEVEVSSLGSRASVVFVVVDVSLTPQPIGARVLA